MIKKACLAAAILGMAACSSPEELTDDVGVEMPDPSGAGGPVPPQPPETPEGADASTPPKAGGVNYENNEEQDGATREFSYVWPKEVSAIPALETELTEKRTAALGQQKTWWAQSIADCPPEYTTCRSSTYELEWQVVADLPRYLSLSHNFYTYTGGAHGNYGRGSLVWDREADASLNPKDMFVSLDALDKAISDAACELLNEERTERRDGETFRSAGEWPNQCVSMEETVLFLGSSGGDTFDRVGVFYGPYIAGAYAEGAYEFTLPVTPAVIAALKPDYRNAFSAK